MSGAHTDARKATRWKQAVEALSSLPKKWFCAWPLLLPSLLRPDLDWPLLTEAHVNRSHVPSNLLSG